MNDFTNTVSQYAIQVKVDGEPKPRVRWTYNEKPLFPTSEVKVVEEADGWHMVRIDKVQPMHSGMYTVIAEVSSSFRTC